MNFNQYMTFSDVKKRKFVNKYDPGIYFCFKGYNYSVWQENEEESID